MGRQLRIGVPSAVRAYPPRSSPGRIWANALDRLGTRARVVVQDPGRQRLRQPDVWLTDGHQGPLDVGAPVVAHLHEAAWADPELRPLLDPGFLTTYEQPSSDAARAAARIITVSQSSKAQIVGAYGVAADRVVVAHNGVDHAVYRPGLPRSSGLDVEGPYVLFVSTVHPRKNLGALRDALALLAAGGRVLRLVLVAGPAPDRPDSAALAAAAVAPIEGHAVPNLAGAADGVVAELMANAVAVVQPSLMEGFGMAVAEAMACGTPVVVSDRGSLPEVVGGAGVIVEPTAAAIAAGLAVVLDEPAEAAAARRARGIEVASRYTWEAMADRWWSAIEAAADHRA